MPRWAPLGALVNNAGVIDDRTGGRVDTMAGAAPRAHVRDQRDRLRSVRARGRKADVDRHGGQGGVIVNLSSVAARLGSPKAYVDYAASKGAIETFTIGLGHEVAGEGIRVAAIRPGLIDTEIHASGGEPDRAQRLGAHRADEAGRHRGRDRRAIVWLMSDDASYVISAILDVSGGR